MSFSFERDWKLEFLKKEKKTDAELSGKKKQNG